MKKFQTILAMVALVFMIGACATTQPLAVEESNTSPPPTVVPEGESSPSGSVVIEPNSVETSAPAPVPIVYEVRGSDGRVNAVAAYLRSHGIDAIAVVGPEVMGSYNGKPWPGVNVVRQGESSGEGIWVPVSDAALKKGLCADQRSQLDALPRTSVATQTVFTGSGGSAVAVVSGGGACQDLPFERRGFWTGVQTGGIFAEVKMKPVGFKVTLTQVSEITCIPQDCYITHQLPDAGELSGRWGDGWSLVRQWPAGDGGKHSTIQLWQR